MSDPRLNDYLAHMASAIADIMEFVSGFDLARFAGDRRTQQAVILGFIVLGEAASRVAAAYPEFVASNPQIPWRAMRGMRNRLAHGYFDVDIEIVWETAVTAIPDLASKLTAVREQL